MDSIRIMEVMSTHCVRVDLTLVMRLFNDLCMVVYVPLVLRCIFNGTVDF